MKSIALPEAFVQRVTKDPFLGTALLDALETTAPTSLRVHPHKGAALFSDEKTIPWSEFGKRLDERPVFTLDPLFHAGCYYPQEAGSQLLNYVLRQLDLPEQPIALDLCAAPGGKSSLILDFLNHNGLLVSNEIITSRARILYENLTKWGYGNSMVTNNAPDAFGKLNAFFDLIVVDAPCSGEGMFRKDAESRLEWSEANVAMCAERQQEIVESCWSSLKTGGHLVYSTCTFNSDENEENIQWICDELGAEIVELNYPKAFGNRNGIGAYALPHLVDTEGFFIAVLRKTTVAFPSKKKNKGKPAFAPLTADKELQKLVASDANQQLMIWKEKAWAIPAALEQEIGEVINNLNVFKAGVCVAESARKGWIPDESLALSLQALHSDVPRIPLTKNEALVYLKGDTFSIEPGNGYAVMTYENIPLGWIKRIGNRFNNYYPKEWRIRMKI